MHTGGRRSAIGHLGACALADGCAQVSRRTAGSHPAAMHLQMVARKSAGSHTSTFALHVGAQMSGGTTGSHLVDSHEQNLTQDRKLKRTGGEKKPKAKKEAEGAAAAETSIPPAQKVKLQKMIDALVASKMVVQDKLEEVSLLSEYVSPAVVTKASALAHELDAVIASITLTLESNAGDLAEIKSEDLKSQAKQCVLLLSRGIKDGEMLRDGLSGQPAAKKQRKASTKAQK